MVDNHLVELGDLVPHQLVLESNSEQAGVGAPALPSGELLSFRTQQWSQNGDAAARRRVGTQR